MNISKWVNFVLSEGKNDLSTEENIGSTIRHFLVFNPEDLTSKFIEERSASVRSKLLENIKSSGLNLESLEVNLFDARPYISFEEVLGSGEEPLPITTESLLEAIFSKEKSSWIEESQYTRMRQYGIYKFGCLIEYEASYGESRRGLDDIVSDIRAIPTVTIVSVVLANEKISEGRYVAGLQIKFIPSYPGSLTQPEDAKSYILRMIRKVRNVKGISRVTLKTDRIE